MEGWLALPVWNQQIADHYEASRSPVVLTDAHVIKDEIDPVDTEATSKLPVSASLSGSDESPEERKVEYSESWNQPWADVHSATTDKAIEIDSSDEEYSHEEKKPCSPGESY